MKALTRHSLDFEQTFAYIKDNLKKANTLCSEVLNLVEFNRGSFFTLLPKGSNMARLYEFEAGLVVPQYPEQEYVVNGWRGSYCMVPTIQDEMAKIIFQKMQNNTKLSSVFDDVLREEDDPHLDFFRSQGLLYLHKKKVYYIIRKKIKKRTSVFNCLDKSDGLWHSLCVLTATKLKDLNGKHLSSRHIREICIHTRLIIVGAYDSEGYVLWEKNPTNG